MKNAMGQDVGAGQDGLESASDWANDRAGMEWASDRTTERAWVELAKDRPSERDVHRAR